MKALKILIIISAIFSFCFACLTVVVTYYNLDDFFNKECYYNYYPEYSNSCILPSLWLFNGIDADSNGNIYIGCNEGVIVYNQNGEITGGFYVIYSSEQTAFKVTDTQVNIISNWSFNDGDSFKFRATYEASYGFSTMTDEDTSLPDKTAVYNQSFSSYKKENGFNKPKSITKNGKTYTYTSYGKVKINDGKSEKIITLDCALLPVPTRFPLIAMLVSILLGVAFLFAMRKQYRKQKLLVGTDNN